MTRFRLLPGILLAGLFVPLLGGQNPQPPAPQKPAPAVLKELTQKVGKLNERIRSLSGRGVRDPILADIEVYLRAGATVLARDEFTHPDSATWALDAVDRGLLRAGQAAQAEAPWQYAAGQSVVRAYRSRIDGSVQPFAVTLPPGYGLDAKKQWRLDLVLHGRDNGLTEAKFLYQHRETPAPADQNFVRLDVFGRGNNSYRWAGETDVSEALDAFLLTERSLGQRDRLIDLDRVVLRGFSMGGAGAWHIGLHRPDQWCVIGPGAGYTTTHGFVKGLGKLPWYQEACLTIYDAVDYAENAFNAPVVAFAGADDPQRQAAENIQERLKGTGIPLRTIVAPGLEHQFPKEWQKKVEAAYAPFVAKGKPKYPDRVHFVTYTLKYPACHWVEILGIEKHYQRALIDAERTDDGFKVKTANVRIFGLTLSDFVTKDQTVQVDGQTIMAKPWLMPDRTYQVYFEREQGRWQPTLALRLRTKQLRRPQKSNGLVGPIDDAFREPFLCVRGRGKPWHSATNKYVEADLLRFTREWGKYFRGTLPVKDDVEVTNDDIANRNLILFGDPASNSLLGYVLDALPLAWTKEQVVMNGKAFPAANHVPVLIYPNPLNPSRYLVLNSGHTFHEADFQGTNALLFPRLGDFAVLRLAAPESDPLAVEVVTAGLFDEYWQVPKK